MPLGHHFPVDVVFDQQEISVDVLDGNFPKPATGGLLGEWFEKHAATLRALLISYPFRGRMEEAIRAKVPSAGLSPEPVFTFQTATLEAIDVQSEHQLASQALALTPHYAFNTRFTEMTVRITAWLLQRSFKPDGKTNVRVAFRHIYAFHVLLPNGGRGVPNGEAWVALGGPRLMELLDEGVQQSVDMLVFDFSEEGRAQWNTYERGAHSTLNGHKYKGTFLRGTSEWVWTRFGEGMAMSLNGYQIAEASAPAQVEAPATQ